MLKILWFYVHKNPEAEAKRSYAHALERDLVLRRMRVTPLSCCLFSEKTLTIEKTTFSVTSVLIKQKNFRSPYKPEISKAHYKPRISKAHHKPRISEAHYKPRISEAPYKPEISKAPYKSRISKAPYMPRISKAPNFKSPLAPTSSEFQKPSTSPEFWKPPTTYKPRISIFDQNSEFC